MKRVSIILTIALIISLCACARPAEDSTVLDVSAFEPGAAEEEESIDAQAAFDEFLDRQFEDYVTEDTISLHYTLRYPEKLGIERPEPTLGEFGPEYLKKAEAQNREELEELLSFPYMKLREDQKLICDILEYYMKLDKGLFDEELQYFMTMINPVSGAHAELPILLAEYKFYEERDVTDYLALLKDVDRYFRLAIDFEREKSERGLFMPDFAVDDIIESCDSFTSTGENNFLIAVFDEKIEELGLAEDVKDAYKEENKNNVLNDVIPAYKTLVEGLKELKGTGLNDRGLAGFDKGKQYYEYLLKSDIGSDESVESLIAMIDERLDTAMYGMSYIAYNNDEIWDLYENPEFGSDDPDEILDMLITGMKDYYPENAGTTHTVKYLYKAMESSFPAAFYLSVPIDDYSSAVIYINRGSMAEGDLFPIMAHEGYPGHLYQDTYFKSREGHPMRKVLSSTGYIEGWATHSEINAYMFADFPTLGAELAMFLGFDTEYRLAIQSRCDIGVNYEGWTREDVKNYLYDLGIESAEASKFIYEYVVKGPAKTLRYFVGFLEIENLLGYAYGELGDAFSYKDFHECILDVGPAPFFIVKRAVHDYVTDIKENGRFEPAA